ncbi:MAG: hypothetical protein IPF98_24965 [Gemmatimonadetes bacterium]|nr:hypothetical protein [Gemmatimonadota bacterium]
MSGRRTLREDVPTRRPAWQAAVDAMAVLRDESPDCYRRVSERMAEAPARLVVGDETLGITASDGIVHLRDVAPPGHLMEATLDASSVVRLVDGTSTIEQLMALSLLDVRGHPDALLAFLGAARAVGDAGTRSAALQRIFERFREQVG